MSGDAWYSKILAKMDEPSLFERKDDKEVSSYRFLWLRGEHEPVCVRIEKISNDIKGRMTRLSGMSGHNFGGIIDQREFTLSGEEWSKLQEKLSATHFWGMSSPPPPLELGGSNWIVEGITGARYHVVDCRTPLGAKGLQAFVTCGKYFLQLAHIQVPDSEFY
jgi:hypothetical protein